MANIDLKAQLEIDIEHWKNDEQKYEGKSKIIDYIEPYIEEPGTLHELGCSNGNILSMTLKKWHNLKLSGNDINYKAIKNKIFESVWLENTIDFLKRNETIYDYLLSSAHLVHISYLFNNLLKEKLPKMVNKYLFCLEDGYNNSCIKIGTARGNKSAKYSRKWNDFFGNGLKLIERYNYKKGYDFFVWKKIWDNVPE